MGEARFDARDELAGMGSDREEGDRDDEDSHFEVMQSLKAPVHHGRLVLDEPTDLPEGSDDAVASSRDPSFAFCGFDLIDEQVGIRALTNCGGVDKAFLPGDLSDCGLLVDLARAVAVRQLLLTEYRDEPHARAPPTPSSSTPSLRRVPPDGAVGVGPAHADGGDGDVGRPGLLRHQRHR